MENKLIRRLHKIESLTLFHVAKQSFIFMFPIIILGNFALLFINLPSNGYQMWLTTEVGGIFRCLLNVLYAGTLPLLSLYTLLAVTYVYNRKFGIGKLPYMIMNALLFYLIIVAANVIQFTMDVFQPTNFLIAFLSAFLSAALFQWIVQWLRGFNRYTVESGFDIEMDYAIGALIAILGCSIVAFAFDIIVVRGSGYETLDQMLHTEMRSLFSHIGHDLGGTLIYIVLMGVLFMLGIHGAYVFDSQYDIFYQRTIENEQLVATGISATDLPHIINSTVLNNFTFIGGAGAMLCFVIAMLFVMKKYKSIRSLFYLSIIPNFFNISEIAWLGFPIVLNPVMFIPFVCTPVVMFLITYIVMQSGMVPIPFHAVSWLEPVVISGYLSTESWKGGVLQLVCLGVGVAIYIPFIHLGMKVKEEQTKAAIGELVLLLQEKERQNEVGSFLSEGGEALTTDKSLTYDLKQALNKGDLLLYFQPQMNRNGKLYGVEALLRWEHPVAGYIYPPLIIKLATDAQLLDSLGEYIIHKACASLAELNSVTAHPLKMSINLAPPQLENEQFSEKVKQICAAYAIGDSEICFEITEQVAFSNSQVANEQIMQIQAQGIKFHMDDFGMGHSSMVQMKYNQFEAVKLDGSLVKDIANNPRVKNIVKGIIDMSETLDFSIIAEFVETVEQRDLLDQMGCHIYQGYLYAKPMMFADLKAFIISLEE